MSCEYGQTCCEDKNMEADRNKRGLGERREAEREREMQRAAGVPKCWRDCDGMVARGLSAEWALLHFPSTVQEPHAGVSDTQRNTACSPSLASVCCFLVLAWTCIYVFSFLAYVYINCYSWLVFKSSWKQTTHDTQQDQWMLLWPSATINWHFSFFSFFKDNIPIIRKAVGFTLQTFKLISGWICKTRRDPFSLLFKMFSIIGGNGSASSQRNVNTS